VLDRGVATCGYEAVDEDFRHKDTMLLMKIFEARQVLEKVSKT
jgi:hypothetical protein